MGLFFHKPKGPDKSGWQGPNPGWPWTLDVGGMPFSSFGWDDIAAELEALAADPDSFVILNQKNPAASKEYWFLQCAIALAGPRAGQYMVQCGCSKAGAPKLLERFFPSADEVIPLFQKVFHGEPLDLTQFEPES